MNRFKVKLSSSRGTSLVQCTTLVAVLTLALIPVIQHLSNSMEGTFLAAANSMVGLTHSEQSSTLIDSGKNDEDGGTQGNEGQLEEIIDGGTIGTSDKEEDPESGGDA